MSYAALVPSNAQAQHPVSFQYQILEDGVDCYGNTIYSRDITGLGYDWTSTNTSVATISGGYATTQGGGQTQIKVKVNIPNYMTYGPCDGGGGPYFAGIKDSAEECNENVHPIKSRDTQAVSFSKIAYKKESKRISALRPGDCDCITYGTVRTLTADLKVYQVIIKRDGQPVTSSNDTTIVGERISLTAEVLPAGTTVSNHSWTIRGNIIKNYSPTPQSYQTGNVIPAQLNIPNPDFVWVDGGTGRSVRYNATVDGRTLGGEVFFNVAKPDAQINVLTPNTTAIDYATGDLELHLGVNSRNPGIRFSRSGITVPSPFTGTTQWVQTINNTITYEISGTTQQVSVPLIGLDGCYPYTINQVTASDSPGLQLDNPQGPLTYAKYDGQWSMWLMFKPSGVNSSWVPLKNASWSWFAEGQLVNSIWTILNHTDPNASTITFMETTDFPIWSQVISSPRGGSCQ